MTSTTLGLRPTIVDLIFGQNLASSATFIATGAAVTAIAAQLFAPLYPVPVTGQTLAVLVVGMALGAIRGALAMMLYAALGAIGLPVFSDAHSGIDVLLGPSGGYIIGFVVSALIVGMLAEHGWDHTFFRAVITTSIGTAITFMFGMLGIALTLQRKGRETSFQSLLESGVTPFLIGASIKILLAAAILSLSWRAVLRERPTKPVAP